MKKKNILPEKNSKVVKVEAKQYQYSGIIPDAGNLKGYAEIDSDYPNRIIAMTEDNLKSNQECNKKRLENEELLIQNVSPLKLAQTKGTVKITIYLATFIFIFFYSLFISKERGFWGILIIPALEVIDYFKAHFKNRKDKKKK